MNDKKLTPQQAFLKAKRFCVYQERCHSEVKTKLYQLGLFKKEVDEILSTLIEENYLNEERFAIQFAGGHFRIKKWGKVKIKYLLKQKQVSEYCIKTALQSINENAYKQTLQKVFEEKKTTLHSEKNIFNKKRKLQDYLLQKGFEMNLVKELIATL